MSRQSLDKAKQVKNDEFYTLYEDIENELKHYISFLKHKEIFCPCDDLTSNFWKYFLNNFKTFNLQSLTCTSLNGKEYYTNDGINIIEKTLVDNGDFLSEEILNKAKNKIIITNPPFSLLRKFLSKITENNINYILIIPENFFNTTVGFPLYYNKKIKIGFNKVKKFNTEQGIKNFGNILWGTSFPIDTNKPFLELIKSYSPEKYKKYENYDAINVDKIKEIPFDYKEAMGVPITIIEQLNEKQFQVIGCTGAANKFIESKVKFTPIEKYKNNRHGIIEGKLKYMRVFIKKLNF